MLSDNIKAYRLSAGLTQQELGKKIGVSKSTISMYESGERTPPLDIAQSMAQVFCINMDNLIGEDVIINNERQISERVRQLRGKLSLRAFADICGIAHTTLDTIEKGYDFRTGKNIQPKTATLQKIANASNVPLSYITGENKHVVPVLGKVAAGLPIEAVEDILDYEELSPALLKGGGEYFALQIKGDSMEPRICEGDVVIVRKQNTLNSGEVGIICVNGENATCKKVIISQAGVTLLPYNTKHLPMIYTAEQVKSLPVTIIGKVVELRAKF